MARITKVLEAVLRGTSDANIRFADLCNLLNALGFEQREKGSHRIFWRDEVEEIVNVQPLANGKAKPYQVRQIRDIIVRYRLGEYQDEV